jgi:cation diffusion facilitator CzcD-associated flavoprotein CzcO
MYHSIIIGAGFSGLCMAIKLKEKGINNFIILEKAKSVGGTWRENTYPGAECDIPSALYSYSFEPYPKWEYKWSHQPQILEYLEMVAQKYDLLPHIHFETALAGAIWQEDSAHWEIETHNQKIYKSLTFIPAIGQLHHPSFPNFKGMDNFTAPQFHSAKWDHSISLEGKTIGVIGNAASAIQFIPQIAKKAKKVLVFQRSANWMLPKQDRLYKSWEKKLVSVFPFLLKIYRLRLWLLGGGLFFLMKKGNQLLRNFYQNQSIKYINREIKDPVLRKKLIPTYPMGAKRILFSDDYYTAINQDHVEIITDAIEEILPQAVKTSKETSPKLDLLIYATGFITNPFLKDLDIRGLKGISIREAWKEGPKNYLGITVNQFPNLFMMYGPNTNLGHNSIILMSEAQANYIAQALDFLIKNKKKSLEIKVTAQNQYHQKIQERLKNRIWNSIEKSWYKSESGNIPNNWPGRTMEYMRRTKKVNFSHYLIH